MAKVSFLLRHLANLCAPGLIVLLLFFSLNWFHDYPLWRPEVLLVVAAILALGAPFGLLSATAPGTSVIRPASAHRHRPFGSQREDGQPTGTAQ